MTAIGATQGAETASSGRVESACEMITDGVVTSGKIYQNNNILQYLKYKQ